MSFDLHSPFRKFDWFLYQVKDSDKCLGDSISNVFSSVLIFSLIIFVTSKITLFLKFYFFPYHQEITRFQVLLAILDETQYVLILSKLLICPLVM